MTERDKLVMSIRASIPNINVECSSDLESFQNKTLRPILKFQNDLTLSILKSTKGFKQLKGKEHLENFHILLKSFLDKNLKLKNQIVSSVIALFTEEELVFYFENNKAISKRIISMQFKRFADKLGE